ncbi:hypothetical protein JCM11491_006848 [Sporobolomyces phaffii]
MSTLKAKQDQIRQQLNLKNLQRHDPNISEIVTSASYASVYENFGEQWVKTGVEGPMFLFSRTQAPHYGFFVLNRQGLEYIQEFLTPDCELNVGGEFILFESGQNVDKATGIWIFDENERASLCKRMEQLRSAATAVAASDTAKSAPSPPPKPSTAPQSVSLDMLFASSTTQPSTSTTPATPSNASPAQPPTNPLDLLFLNAAARASPQMQARQPPAPQQPAQTQPQPRIVPQVAAPVPSNTLSAIPKTLEQLFAAASPIPQSATLPFQALSQAHLSAPSPSMLPNTLPKNNVPNGAASASGKEESRGMSLLDSIFASAKTNGNHQAPSAPGQPSAAPATTSFPSKPVPEASAPNLSQSSAPSADSRALLAMLGHPSGLATSPPPEVQSLPSTTVHPAPFRMDPSPPQAPDETVSSVGQEIDASEQELGSRTPEQPRPLFAAPLLSHDVFANFPLPSKKKEKKAVKQEPSLGVEGKIGGKSSSENSGSDPGPEQETTPTAAIEEGEAAISEALSHVEESLTDILKSAPAPLPSIAPSQKACDVGTAKQPREPDSREKSRLPKSQVVDLVDSAAANHGLGGGNAADGGSLEREEFMQQIFEMLAKPSVQMQLYGRYLGRVEEAQ